MPDSRNPADGPTTEREVTVLVTGASVNGVGVDGGWAVRNNVKIPDRSGEIFEVT